MIKYSDVYIQTLARGLCEPGEQFVTAGAGSHQSFWTLNIPWFRHDYLLIATAERLIVADHRRGLIFDRMDQVASYRWSDITAMKLGGVFTKKLVLKDAQNKTVLTMKLPKLLLNPLKNNKQNVNTVIQTWEQRRALGAGQQAAGSLPPASYQQPYAQPQQLQQPQGFN